MPDSASATRSETSGILKLLRLCWPRLLAADLLAKALGFLVVTPAISLLLRFYTSWSGSGTPVLTDEDILFFFLTPAGAAALVCVGVFTLWLVFAQHAVMLTIAYGTTRNGAITLRATFRFVATRAVAILRLSASLLLRIVAIVSPFLAAAAITYLALLTRFDINYYLTARPPAFWTAGALLGSISAALIAVLAVKFFHWIFALPLLLFERSSAASAFKGSRSLLPGQRARVAGWLATLAVVMLGISTIVTSFVGLIGRLVIPSASESLTWVALAVGLVVLLSGVANLAVTFLGAALLSLLVVRFYVGLGRSGYATAPVSTPVGPQSPPRSRNLRRVIIWGSTCAIVATVFIAIATVRSIPAVDTTQITAHRGSSAAAPENTLAAVEQAIADGADWVEIDVQEIADGTVIVFHDGDLKRLGGISLSTVASTYDDISQVDIGTWFSPAFADQRIATLEQVLELCKDRIRVNIELKYYGAGGDLEQRVIDIVERWDMESQVVLMSLSRSGILMAKALRPDWKMGFLTAVALGDLTKIDVDFLAVHARLATRALIWSAHRSGKEVHVWTVNDPVQMWALISRGADNLITDVPALGRDVLTERAGMGVVERLLVEFGAWTGLIPSSAEISSEGDT
ncbi:MAG: glycerophosphoryl diester phosphodiesterase membrane domain-containing protein [Gemmatimonadota bacterium]|nr:MAG: glycerophosphoryl diester phosphodiesterase membrane domain-containing protein [Gemmatimonadota bacterium]